MKTQNLKVEVFSSTNLISATDKIVFETATDIWSLTFFKKGWFGIWHRKYYYWGFSGTAKVLLEAFNNWLEDYPVKK